MFFLQSTFMMKAEQVFDNLFVNRGLMGIYVCVCVCVCTCMYECIFSVLKKVQYARNNQRYVMSVQIIKT